MTDVRDDEGIDVLYRRSWIKRIGIDVEIEGRIVTFRVCTRVALIPKNASIAAVGSFVAGFHAPS